MNQDEIMGFLPYTKPFLFVDYLMGFWKAKSTGKPLFVTREQARFFRNYRWKKMKEKLF
jgi:hypothetical protein